MKKRVVSEKYRKYYPESEEMDIYDYQIVGKMIIKEKVERLRRWFKTCLKRNQE